MTTGTHRPRGAGNGPALPPGPGDRPDPPGVPPGSTGGSTDTGPVPALPGGRPPEGGPARPVPGRPAPAAGALSRVSVLAPRTRIDLALPGDVPLAELVPVLLDMAGEPPGPGPGWTLALLGSAPEDPERTLAGLGVLDGDQLVLRRPAEAAPLPLYDDVVDAVAEAAPTAYRAWDAASAHRVATIALGAALTVASAALLAAGRGPGTAGGMVTAVVAGLVAAGTIALAAASSRLFAREAVGAVLAVGGVVAAGVGGVAAVPASPPTGAAGLLCSAGAPHLLLGSVLVLVAAVLALAAVGTASRSGLAVLLALAAVGGLGALTGLVAVLADAVAPPGGGPDAAAVAAGVGAAALVGLAGLPRAGMAVARLPLPQVPGSAQELSEDTGVTEYAEIERRADRAHAAMTGLVLAVGTAVVAACAVLAAAPAPGLRGVLGWTLAALLVVLLGLRSRTYANAAQAVVLLLGALLAAVALLTGAVRALPAGATEFAVVGLALAAGSVTLLLGFVAPGRRSSPVARRAVGIVEAVGIAAVLPLGLGVMDLYSVMRLL